jgi:hypothetical protein
VKYLPLFHHFKAIYHKYASNLFWAGACVDRGRCSSFGSGKKWNFLNIRIIYDKFLIRIIIIVVKLHNQLKISRLNPVNKINNIKKSMNQNDNLCCHMTKYTGSKQTFLLSCCLDFILTRLFDKPELLSCPGDEDLTSLLC